MNNIVITQEMIELFAQLSGDRNRLHFDDEYAKETLNGKCQGRIAHGGLIFALLSGYIFEEFGDGTMVRKAECCFKLPIEPGDAVAFTHQTVLNRTIGPSHIRELMVTVTKSRDTHVQPVGQVGLTIILPPIPTMK